ncbi:hypothetical protein SEVIR_8G230000v4 [Setaria viridis]|uniref:Bifunctional inhibitor/plant lipid transfer protein/seed storage helical domain-containing protein n=2 Tax=Setaria TaxID=4554 RepID=A0A368SAK5_SETIT|nr:hypothetical protein SETIT_8G219000v2 [Setaria italica]TKW02189.1 hypothetical protein SEVIR_8G230000v2 [Setaria viridis]
MASANGAVLQKVVPVATCIALVLLSMGSPAMADIQDDCRPTCVPICQGLATNVCNAVIDLIHIQLPVDIFPTCKVRVSAICDPVCINVCSLNTLSPGAPTPAPASTAAPPPCKP